MAVVAAREEIGVRATGQTTQVAQDASSRLMYYVHCVNCLLPDLDLPSNLTDYEHVVLNKAGDTALLKISAILSPANLKGLLIENNDIESGNEFLQLSKARQTLAVAESTIIAGEQVQVVKVMLYKPWWIERYYYTARAELMTSMQSSCACTLL